MLVTLTRKKGKPKMTVINYEKDKTTDFLIGLVIWLVSDSVGIQI